MVGLRIIVDKFLLQGKPTLFGNPYCDETTFECLNQEVIQYDPEEDTWKSLGLMSEPRVFPTVIEVPASFCDVYQTGSTTADPDPLGLEETAMLVIGGRTGSVNGIKL